MSNTQNTKASFKKIGNNFEVVVYQPHRKTVEISDLPLALTDLGLAAKGAEETKILQLLEGQEITLPVNLPV